MTAVSPASGRAGQQSCTVVDGESGSCGCSLAFLTISPAWLLYSVISSLQPHARDVAPALVIDKDCDPHWRWEPLILVPFATCCCPCTFTAAIMTLWGGAGHGGWCQRWESIKVSAQVAGDGISVIQSSVLCFLFAVSSRASP